MPDRWMDLRNGRMITVEPPDGDLTIRCEFSSGRGRRAKIHLTWPSCWGDAEILSASTDLDDTHPGE